jgi:GT2 family glycosyltransferase
MSLIAMAVHDTEENDRTQYTRKTLYSLFKNVDLQKHRLFIINNGSCVKTNWMLNAHQEFFTLITLSENIGTAAAINLAWKQRMPGEHCIKIDNDVVINHEGWVEEMEAAIAREPLLGQVGLKRKDCWECPDHENPEIRSKLVMLPHIAGEPWIVVEQAKHIIGTCVMHNAALIDKIGGLYQPGLYGYDDVLMSWRSYLAGFISVFLPHINIDHIDAGQTEYTDWKTRHAGQYTKVVSDLVDSYITDKSKIVYPL